MNDKTTTPLEPTAALFAGDSSPRIAKRLFFATRPKFFPASIMPVLLGTAWGYAIGGSFDPWLFVLALLATVSVHAASNVLNDVGDELGGSDRSNKDRIYPYTGGSRFIQNELMSTREMGLWAISLFAFAMVLGGVLTVLRGPGVLLFGLAGVALGATYSVPRIQLSAHGLGEGAVAIAFGMIPVSGAAWLQSGILDADTILVSLPISLWVAAILLINEVPDIPADAGAGKRTLAVRLGRNGTGGLYFALHVGAFLAIGVAVARGLLPWWSLVLPLLLVIVAYRAAQNMRLGAREPMTRAIEMTLAIHTVGSLWLVGAILYVAWAS